MGPIPASNNTALGTFMATKVTLHNVHVVCFKVGFLPGKNLLLPCHWQKVGEKLSFCPGEILAPRNKWQKKREELKGLTEYCRPVTDETYHIDLCPLL